MQADLGVHRITNDLNQYDGVSLTADSRTLATVQLEFSSDAWVALIAEADNAKPITSGGHTDWSTWSPDGRIVCTKVTGGGVGNIWVMESDGRNASQLTVNTEGTNYAPRVSPDGRRFVFASPSEHIWRMDMDGNNAKQLTNSPLDSFDLPDFSPDGKWVVYTKWGAEKGISKVSIEGGDPVRLNDAAAHSPVISPNGKWIAYSYWDKKATPKQVT